MNDEFLHWKKETEPGLDVPMLHPSRIPQGYTQSWDYDLNQWVIRSNRGMARKHGDNPLTNPEPVVE